MSSRRKNANQLQFLILISVNVKQNIFDELFQFVEVVNQVRYINDQLIRKSSQKREREVVIKLNSLRSFSVITRAHNTEPEHKTK